MDRQIHSTDTRKERNNRETEPPTPHPARKQTFTEKDRGAGRHGVGNSGKGNGGGPRGAGGRGQEGPGRD